MLIQNECTFILFRRRENVRKHKDPPEECCEEADDV